MIYILFFFLCLSPFVLSQYLEYPLYKDNEQYQTDISVIDVKRSNTSNIKFNVDMEINSTVIEIEKMPDYNTSTTKVYIYQKGYKVLAEEYTRLFLVDGNSNNNNNNKDVSVPLNIHEVSRLILHLFSSSSLSLIREYSRNELAFTKQLKHKGVINYEQFTLSPKDKKLIFGSQGNYYTSNNNLRYATNNNNNYYDSNTLTCKADTSIPEWGCKLNSISVSILNNNDIFTYDNTLPERNFPLYFQPNEQNLLAPSDFIVNLKEYLSSFYSELKCLYFSSHFECNCDLIHKLNDISFAFNDVYDNKSIKLNFKSFITKGQDPSYVGIEKITCRLNIMVNKRDNKFIVGNSFMDHFESKFDYEKNEISFSSTSEDAVVVNANDTNTKQIMLGLNSIMLLSVVGCGFIMFWLKMRNNMVQK